MESISPIVLPEGRNLCKREEEKVCSELYNSVTEWVEYPKEKYLECKNLKLENFES